MTDNPMNYLKREDESQLEQWGYTSYKGEYGWSHGNTPLFKIIGRNESGTWATFEISERRFGDRRDEDLKFTGVDGYIRNTLAPAPSPPKEIVFDAGGFWIESYGMGGRVLMGRLALLVDSDIGMKIQEFRANIDREEYDLVFRRRK